ncbi:hypothetical protein BFINE_48910 [Bacteroides finegoldii DSM 17565]|nr:hypothetical protein BFINE_48910 [Bacteroides finegoldii DSM 17565]
MSFEYSNHLLTAYNEEVFRYLDKKFGQEWRKEVPPGIFGLDQSLNELHDYNWLIKTLSRKCKYPVAQQKRNKGCVLQVEYTVTRKAISAMLRYSTKYPVHSESQ